EARNMKQVEIRRSKGEDFDRDDQRYVYFMMCWGLHYAIDFASSLNDIGATILRATRRYDDQVLDRKTCSLFLQEIGVASPWEDRTVYEPKLMLYPELPPVPKHLVAQPMGTMELNEDAMKYLRKDWKD